MAETNWNFLTSGLDAASVARGVSSGFAPPPGGGNFLFGFHSLDASSGAVGLYCNEVNFNPLKDDASNDTGGSISGAVKRGISGGTTGFSPFLFIGLQGDTVNDKGYFLGLSNNDPYDIILVKGVLTNGLDPTAAGVLARGSVTYLPDVWHHLRLDMIVNPNGDVVLNAYRNDLSLHNVNAPVWEDIPGISQFIDDALGVNSALAGNPDLPYVGGRVGFAFTTSEQARRSFLDWIIIGRQK
jgi:hypothetical protein